MFSNRDQDRRPSADMVALFKEQHFSPENISAKSDDSSAEGAMSLQGIERDDRLYAMQDDTDPTPKASSANFRFTPSFLDPNSAAFAAFAAQPPAYYTPTAGGLSMTYQENEMAAHLFTPEGGQIAEGKFGIHQPSQSPPTLFSQSLEGDRYMRYRPLPYSQDNRTSFSIQPSVVGRGPSSDSSPSQDSPDRGHNTESTTDTEMYEAREVEERGRSELSLEETIDRSAMSDISETFRFQTTLHAATAMLRHPNDIPVSYLNKRQTYAVSVIDTSVPFQNSELKSYRTTLRIAFDENEQRRTAPACWRLWKDGRGTLESGGNPDKLRAIDFEAAETRAVNEKKGNTETQLRFDDSSVSFDRFTIVWSSTSSRPTINFCVRFLFLSTDFSHSKGVKGVPVRLVAKTELFSPQVLDSTFSPSQIAESELCYCKIKLFRDKGAERKLANDRQHLERAVKKLRQQANQLTHGSIDSTFPNSTKDKKKKRHSFTSVSSTSLDTSSNTGNTTRRHRRDWSISSSASNLSSSGRSVEDELQRKLDKATAMEAMFQSIQSVSVFSLRGDPTDDPSLFSSPIAPESIWDVPGSSSLAVNLEDVQRLSQANDHVAQEASPAESTRSISSAFSERLERSEMSFAKSNVISPLSPPDSNAKVHERITVSHRMTGKVSVTAVTKEIEALGVDHYYAPSPATPMPAICVFITPAIIATGAYSTIWSQDAIDSNNDIYYAVYASARTASSFIQAVATKMGIEPDTVVQAVVVEQNGAVIHLDDDVVREMRDKQDMRVAYREIRRGVKSEGGEAMHVHTQKALELLLAFNL